MIVGRLYNAKVNISSSGGFFGRLWGRIRGNIGIIVGALLGGGVIGGLLGGILQGFINNGGSISFGRGIVAEQLPEKYPLTLSEEKLLDKVHVLQIQPTVISLANKIDQSISIETLNKSISAYTTNLTKANEVLWAISIIKANNTNLLNFGAKESDNFIKNKVGLIELYLNALEKLIVKYLEDNNGQEFKLVLEKQKVSKTTKVGSLILGWNGKEVVANVKKYIPIAIQTTSDQMEVEVVNTDPESAGDITNSGAQEHVIDSKDSGSNGKLLKRALFVLTSAIILKKI